MTDRLRELVDKREYSRPAEYLEEEAALNKIVKEAERSAGGTYTTGVDEFYEELRPRTFTTMLDSEIVSGFEEEEQKVYVGLSKIGYLATLYGDKGQLKQPPGLRFEAGYSFTENGEGSMFNEEMRSELVEAANFTGKAGMVGGLIGLTASTQLEGLQSELGTASIGLIGGGYLVTRTTSFLGQGAEKYLEDAELEKEAEKYYEGLKDWEFVVGDEVELGITEEQELQTD